MLTVYIAFFRKMQDAAASAAPAKSKADLKRERREKQVRISSIT